MTPSPSLRPDEHERTTEVSSPSKGDYLKPHNADLRGPCPLLNTLANHGYLPRDGRGLHANELYSALGKAGLSVPLRALLANPIFLQYHGKQKQESKPFLSRTWYLMRNPWALFFSEFGMRDPDQYDPDRKRAVLDLDQIGREGVAEHDISLTRLDRAQGDCLAAQLELVDELLAISSDGGKTITLEDLAKLRLKRIEKQKADNPELLYGPKQHRLSCMEIALILCVFGDGKQVLVDHVRALFADERLPIEEGWRKRKWWSTLGFRELGSTSKRVQELVGYTAG
ncbi:putative peroxidase [Cladorrhinum sp. PSN259]|nr:putative peroxidase [Cladorrhinum sp. PSN259]